MRPYRMAVRPSRDPPGSHSLRAATVASHPHSVLLLLSPPTVSTYGTSGSCGFTWSSSFDSATADVYIIGTAVAATGPTYSTTVRRQWRIMYVWMGK